MGPFSGDAEACRQRLAAWDADLLPASTEAAAYAHFRRAIARAMFEPILGAKAWAWATRDENFGIPVIWMTGLLARLDADYHDNAPGDSPWSKILPPALESAWQATQGMTRRWDSCHGTNAKHPLSSLFPALAAALDQPRTPLGGDGDTIKSAAYGWSKAEFDVLLTSVYRQAVDLADITHTTSIIPGGASGLPGTPHYADQVECWRVAERIPMPYTVEDVAASAAHTLVLRP
jgi:penicillin amidase